jgi:hypothetical protein
MNQETIQKVYDEISQLQIELEPDPTVLGTRYISEITAKCRNHLNKVTLIRLRISQEKRALKSKMSGEETLLSAERDQLLAEDETVRRQPNLRDREAVANTFLKERVNTISQLKNELFDLETVEKAVTLVHDELIRTSSEIKTQRSVMLADRSSGAGYGDEYDGPRGSRRSSPPPSSIDEGELDRIMSGDLVTEELPVVYLPSISTASTILKLVEVNIAKPEPEAEEDAGLPEELASTSKKSIFDNDEEIPAPVKLKDPSAGLEEDPEVLGFLDVDIKFEAPAKVETKPKAKSTVEPKPAASAAKSKVEDDDDFLSSLLQNI